MGTSKTINDNGKIIRVNTKALREKYKDYPNINKKISKIHKASMGGGRKEQFSVGGGNNRLKRYRIPPKLINDLLDCMTF